MSAENSQNSQKTRKKAFAERRKGFALVEAIVAIVILTLSIFASFQTIAYALSITTEVRGRRERYEQLANIGLAYAAERADGGAVENIPNIEIEIVSKNENAAVQAFINGVPVETNKPELTRYAYRYTSQTGKMKSPFFVIFLKE
ncbi:MAG: hypothetical protein LBR71_05435 [Synergistaceae bacterium]|jgi:Tfp pilus assembly protein PilV|nr:hypothetical protein [Synergistaceae bacterium]